MDVVTFETAKALREAGFPQPRTKFSQIWYFLESKQHLLIINGGANPSYVIDGVRLIYRDHIKDMSIVYAPTATDILRGLPEGFVLHKRMGVFHCLIIPKIPVGAESIYGTPFGSDTNPAEACAAAWLDLNKQTND